MKYKTHDITISFDAPALRSLDQNSLTIENNKEFEANFQWKKYAILFTGEDKQWLIFVTNLYPWGTIQSGGEELHLADSLGNIKDGEVTLTTEEAKKALSDHLPKSGLEHLQHSDVQVAYINANKNDLGKKYSTETFNNEFIKSGRYIVLTKTRQYMDPFGTLVGKAGTPAKDKEVSTDETEQEKKAELYRAAVRLASESEYETGGFDIMKKFVKKTKTDKKRQ